MSTPLERRKAVQRILGVEDDGIFGAKTRAAFEQLAAAASPDAGPVQRILRGDGTWPWTAAINGDDIVVKDARATCFGGSDDPQDSGETASGVSTKKHPLIAAVSLPMDGRMFTGLSSAEHRALDGSPIPRVPFMTHVHVVCEGRAFEWPVIDLGPGKRTGNAIDLTITAARCIDKAATARNFEARVDFRILGGAKFVV